MDVVELPMMLPFTAKRGRHAGPGCLAVLLVSAIGVSHAFAQNPPLGEVARQEEARRKTTKPPVRILTNKDLPAVAAPAPAAAPAADAPATAPAASAASDKPQKTDTSDKTEKPDDEASWRARIAEPRDALKRDEVLLDALQARVNGLAADFVGRDDPYQRARIGEDRQKAIAEMERVRTEIAALKKAIADIEEEARKASVPPGWLR